MKKANLLLSIIAIGMSIFLYMDNRAYHKAVITLKKEHVKLAKTVDNELEKMLEGTSTYLKKGLPAPSFSFPDEDGKMVHENDSEKKNTLLVFSSSQCPHCQEFYPVLNKFQKSHPDTEVLVLQEFSTSESNRKFLDSTKYGFKMLAAVDEVFINYRIEGTPTCVLLDSKHAIDATLVAPTLAELSSSVQ